ncbi:hypothetical protein LEN26_016690 [Aphanomyces euteiches]|nr:hypothetical protein LEN26_016690 [Aphanomyces euteiches]KAH9112116.1 hypothetical protein AeMF1_013500 [Aphanomyces euteiches]
MARVFGMKLTVVGLMQVAKVACDLYGPYVLQEIVSSMESPGGLDVKASLQLIGTLVVVRVIGAFLSAHSIMQSELVVVKITSALQQLLFQKTLRLDVSSRRNKSTGEISNYFSADIRTIINFSYVVNRVWIYPLQILLTLLLLYLVIGWSTFIGAGVVALSLVVNQPASNGIQKSFGALMGQRDVRMKAVNEIFGGIQIIKLNAWEDKFAEKLGVERTRELGFVWTIFFWAGVTIVLLNVGPVLVTISSFASYTLLQKEALPASKLFTALSYLTMLKSPFSQLSYVVSTTLRAIVSLWRIMEFLALDEKKKDVIWTPSTAPADKVKKYSEENIAITIEDASIGWDADKPLFKNANLTVKHGEFVVIHGSWQHLCRRSHRLLFKQSWIQNLTIRENILFGKPYDREKYNRVIEACALPKDLSLFAAGDRAEIGQKGINLSGGQKARVCLARACYSDADIFILDSPLSAVDAIVQNEIFTKCFLGLLHNKTILLVTHSRDIIGSTYIDHLVLVKDGQLIETAVNNQKNAIEPSVQPLAAHPTRYLTAKDEDGLVADDPASYGGANNYSVLLSPSISTPMHADRIELFTPADKTADRPLEDVASGQFVFEEERNQGNVTAQVYKDYLAAAGGWCMLLRLFFILMLWQGIIISSDLWLNVWTSTATKVTPHVFVSESAYYLAVYSLLALVGIAVTILRSMTIYSATLRASKVLFDRMTNALLVLPCAF